MFQYSCWREAEKQLCSDVKHAFSPSASRTESRQADAEHDQEGRRHGQDEVRVWRRSASHAGQVAAERGTPPGETLMEIYCRRAAPGLFATPLCTQPELLPASSRAHIWRDFYLFIKMQQSLLPRARSQINYAHCARWINWKLIHLPSALSAARRINSFSERDGPRWRFFSSGREKATFFLFLGAAICEPLFAQHLNFWLRVFVCVCSAPRLICLLN